MSDLIVRGGVVVEATGPRRADVRIAAGTVVEVAAELGGTGEEIDARGLTILPGVVDLHVHFNEPGRTNWEGAASGSRALAAGGGTTFVDMPLNSTPCVVTGAEVDRKREALEQSSIADFGLWGGLVPGHVDDMAAMAARGVVGFKAFMCESGLPEFPYADERTLRQGMRQARELGLPVAIHAELPSLIGPVVRPDAASFLASRPLRAELDAIDTALRLAAETGVALHIVHVSSGRGVTLAAEARLRGVDVSIETCPHYLTFTDRDVERLGVMMKCAPPLRPDTDRSELWQTLLTGQIDIVGSDHSPAPPSMKVAGDFAHSWGGVAGVQSTLPVLLTRGVHERAVTLERVASLLAMAPARRLRMARKGLIAPGYDADLTLVDLNAMQVLSADDLLQRHRLSPYVGMTFRGVVRRTIRRGETIFCEGAITATGGGTFIRPTSNDGSSCA